MGNLKMYLMRVLDERLSNKIVKRLHSLPKREWLSYNHSFNSWEFPREFYDLIPKWWCKAKVAEREVRLVKPVMDIVEETYGEEAVLSYHNILGGFTKDEFKFWYENYHKSNNSQKLKIHCFHERKYKVREIKWWEDDVFERLSNAKVW